MRVILENIRSMHNVGSVFRTSDAVGVEKIYLCGYTPAPIHEQLGHLRPQIEKVALGATSSVAWEKRTSAWRLVDELKKQGHTIIVLEQSAGSVGVQTVRLSKQQWNNAVLVVGHELKGVSKGVLKRAGIVADIPMQGQKHSLNVSVAFGVAMYTLYFTMKI